MRKSIALLAFLTVLGFAAPRAAVAGPISFTVVGINDPTVTASILMNYDPVLALLSFNITNTSTQYNPALTGFAFNAPTGVTGISNFTSSPAGWSYSFTSNGINTPGQFGFFDAAALTGPNFNGGKPNLGIAIGQTVNFGFTLTGSNLASLNTASFYNVLSSGQNSQPFIARFQRTGPTGNGSEVAIPGTTPVPEPTSLVLTGIALAGLAAKRRRSKRSA